MLSFKFQVSCNWGAWSINRSLHITLVLWFITSTLVAKRLFMFTSLVWSHILQWSVVLRIWTKQTRLRKQGFCSFSRRTSEQSKTREEHVLTCTSASYVATSLYVNTTVPRPAIFKECCQCDEHISTKQPNLPVCQLSRKRSDQKMKFL